MTGRQRFSFWIFIIAALVLVIFSVQNAHEVDFYFFTWKGYLSLSVLLIVTFLIGLIAGAIFSFRRSATSKSKKKKLEEAEIRKDQDQPKIPKNTEAGEIEWPE